MPEAGFLALGFCILEVGNGGLKGGEAGSQSDKALQVAGLGESTDLRIDAANLGIDFSKLAGYS